MLLYQRTSKVTYARKMVRLTLHRPYSRVHKEKPVVHLFVLTSVCVQPNERRRVLYLKEVPGARREANLVILVILSDQVL